MKKRKKNLPLIFDRQRKDKMTRTKEKLKKRRRDAVQKQVKLQRYVFSCWETDERRSAELSARTGNRQ